MKSSSDLYLEEINKIPLLTLKEEQELGRKIKIGDKESINKMVEHNLRLVIPIAKYYLNRGLSFEDLIQHGNLGLIAAAERYDVDKGTKFSTYAVPWIKQHIARSIENYSRNIRIPNGLYRKISKYNAQKEKLETEKGEKFSLEQLSEKLNINIDKIKKYEKLSTDTISLSTEINVENYEETNTIEDLIYDDYNLEDEIISKIRDKEILKFVKELIKKQRDLSIIFDKYNLLYTNKELGEKYNIPETTVRSILTGNLKKMKNSQEILYFIDYALNEDEVINNLHSSNCYLKSKIKKQ